MHKHNHQKGLSGKDVVTDKEDRDSYHVRNRRIGNYTLEVGLKATDKSRIKQKNHKVAYEKRL
jgi:hypothetical protein